MSDQEPRGRVERQGEYGVIYIPMTDVHALRVALRPCPCKGPKSIGTRDIRARLEKGLAKLEAMR